MGSSRTIGITTPGHYRECACLRRGALFTPSERRFSANVPGMMHEVEQLVTYVAFQRAST